MSMMNPVRNIPYRKPFSRIRNNPSIREISNGVNKRAILIILLFLLTPLLAEDKQDVRPVSKDEVLNELKNAPKTNPDREKKLATLYQQAGAKKEEVKLQKFTGG